MSNVLGHTDKRYCTLLLYSMMIYHHLIHNKHLLLHIICNLLKALRTE